MTTKTKSKDAEITALAEAMLRELEVLRQSGAGAPRLRELAERTGLTPTEDQIRTAAGMKVFTTKAVATEKVDRKPSLESPVCFKEDVPAKTPAPKRAAARKPKDDGSELAGRMLLVLEAQRRLGAEAYPPTLRRLAELCDLNASDTRVTKAAAHKVLINQLVVAAKAKGGKPSLDAPVVLRDDVDRGAPEVLTALLIFGLQPVMTEGTGKNKGKITETTAFTTADIKARLVPALKPITDAMELGIERQELPEGVAWVLTKGKPYLFLVEYLRPGAAQVTRPPANVATAPAPDTAGAPPRPAQDFAAAFREAFEQLDRRNGATNFVKLADLRRALAVFGREEFDSGLRALRLRGEFALDSHEGLHGSLTPEEREAGVREAGSLLVYVSRR
jgi:hypothetical protein